MRAKDIIVGYWKSRERYKGTTYEDEYRRLSKADECLVWYIHKLKREIRKLARENNQLRRELDEERLFYLDMNEDRDRWE